MASDLNTVNNNLTDKILDGGLLEDLFAELGWQFTHERNAYRGKCFHRGSDGQNLVVFTHGDNVRVNWKCYSGNCEEKYISSLLGLVRGFLSSDQPKNCPVKDAIIFLKKFIRDHENAVERPARAITKTTSPPPEPAFGPYPREKIRRWLTIPSRYFLETRRFSAEALDRFDVGHSEKRSSQVCPLYDDVGNMCVSFIERTNLPLCEKCQQFHEDAPDCWLAYPKQAHRWKNASGPRPPAHLYGYHVAQEVDRPEVFVVEGAPDVWRAYEAGRCAVGLLGSKMSNDQLKKLLTLNRTIVLALDNDGPGRKATEAISAMLDREKIPYRLAIIPAEFKDIGDMPADRVRDIKVVYSEQAR